MPTFATPEPITVAVSLITGQARIVASDRVDTVVEVQPYDAAVGADVKAADQAVVEFTNGRLVVRAPKLGGLFGGQGALDVRIDLPAGSEVRGSAATAVFRCEGQLGKCGFKTGTGDIALDDTGPLSVEAGRGDITAGRVDGGAEVTLGHGTVRLAEVEGPAVVKSAGGDTWIGSAGASVRVNASRGAITVGRAAAAVEARTARGRISIGEVREGSFVLETGIGDIDFGIGEGTSARLDVSTRRGWVENSLDLVDNPQPASRTAAVRARTSNGDIMIRRA
ncbi:hypothetical protein AB0O82_24650 [Kitasatospora sp. NPDC088264]|uniref:DUF4097 family beta strand repeat-containing protein n=1 Tax=Kitasatospora sp. NPDC088264 TaxID=3155296 RepID=UPI003424536A